MVNKAKERPGKRKLEENSIYYCKQIDRYVQVKSKNEGQGQATTYRCRTVKQAADASEQEGSTDELGDYAEEQLSEFIDIIVSQQSSQMQNYLTENQQTEDKDAY